MWYFYILQSEKDSKLYFGSTNDLRRRLTEHNSGLVKSTKPRTPFKVVYYEAYLDEKSARNRESKVKSSRGSRQALLLRINLGV
jgi:putative endonuclease